MYCRWRRLLTVPSQSFDSAGGFQHLGLVQGRDDTHSDIAVGSFQYVKRLFSVYAQLRNTIWPSSYLYIAATGQSKSFPTSLYLYLTDSSSRTKLPAAKPGKLILAITDVGKRRRASYFLAILSKR